jgi:hypothetical protein
MPLALRLNGKANLNRTFRIPTIQSRIPTSSECRSAGVSLYPSSRICGEYQPRQSQFTRSDIYRACANGELGLAFVYDKDLLVWMPMETRSTAWRYIDENRREIGNQSLQMAAVKRIGSFASCHSPVRILQFRIPVRASALRRDVQHEP